MPGYEEEENNEQDDNSSSDESSSESSTEEYVSEEREKKIKKIIELRAQYERIKKANQDLAARIAEKERIEKATQDLAADNNHNNDDSMNGLYNISINDEDDIDPSGKGSDFYINND